ncbi:hypothetical protein [Streptomyces sp. S063]|uniref:hypothetical protein n=1 Tax=Streptomyces sp. S063 TaxID=2005885 RepID=UPI00100828B3|nr:hypothetical protein [Streptomyces sp. S063]
MRRLRLLAAMPAGPALAVGKKAHASLGACYLRSRQASVERAAKARARAVLVVHYDDNPWDPPAADGRALGRAHDTDRASERAELLGRVARGSASV